MDLTQLYGPGYAGYLHGRESIRNNQAQALQGLGLLSQMQNAQVQRQMLQEQLAEKQLNARLLQERDAQIKSYFSKQSMTPQQAGSLPGAPTNENSEMIGTATGSQSLFGMPIDQVRQLYMFGGPDAVLKVMQDNAKMPEKARLIGMLPQHAQVPALLHAAGVAPQPMQFDAGGTFGTNIYDPVKQTVTPISTQSKTSAPASRPAWLNADGSVNEDLYNREMGLKRAGAASAPSLIINSPLMPGKEAGNKVDQGILDIGQQMSSLSSIEQGFRPEYQTIGTKWGALRTGVKERLGLGVDAADKKTLEDFTKYRATAVNALNSYIKAMTGAAMSEPEAERLSRAIPVAGNGVFDGDSPTEFKAKLDSVMKDLRLALARHTYIKRRGFAIGDVPLDQMPKIINERGAEIKTELQSQGIAADSELNNRVRRRLAEEFGLIYER